MGLLLIHTAFTKETNKTSHSNLKANIAYQGRTVNIPTKLAQRENDLQISEMPDGPNLLCEINESVLMAQDYPAILKYNEFRNKFNGNTEPTPDELKTNELLYFDAILPVIYLLELGSLQGSFLEIDKKNQVVRGDLVGPSEKLELDVANILLDEAGTLELRNRIKSADRERFSFTQHIVEIYKVQLDFSYSYIFKSDKVKDREIDLTYEVRVFENWSQNPEINGYAIILAYDKTGFLYSFNIGRCSPPTS